MQNVKNRNMKKTRKVNTAEDIKEMDGHIWSAIEMKQKQTRKNNVKNWNYTEQEIQREKQKEIVDVIIIV